MGFFVCLIKKYHMFKQILFALFLSISTMGFTQIGIGSGPYFVADKVADFSESSLNKLKASKTVFLYGEKDDVIELERMINSVWTLTEIEMLHFSKFESIDFENTSIFSIEETREPNRLSICLQLWMQVKNKKGKMEKLFYSQINLQPNSDINIISNDLHRIRNNMKSKEYESFYEYFYNKERFENLSVGLVKNYLINVNDKLSKGLTLSPNEESIDVDQMRNLKTAIIYIPEYAVLMHNMKSESSKRSEAELKKLFDSYPFEFIIINNEDLNKKILESIEPIYYMNFVRMPTRSEITIYNSVSAEIIYNIGIHPTESLTPKILNKLVKEINGD